MCNMCYGLIYDIITNPLPILHPLRDKLNTSALKGCASELTELFTRAITLFSHKSDFFTKPFYEEAPQDAMGPLRIRIPNTIYSDDVNDIFTWDRFYERYPNESKCLDIAIDLSRDYSIIKGSLYNELSIKEFLMYILRKILTLVPTIHYEHTNKTVPPESKSRGEVPLWKIHQIRDQHGLPRFIPKVSIKNEVIPITV